MSASDAELRAILPSLDRIGARVWPYSNAVFDSDDARAVARASGWQDPSERHRYIRVKCDVLNAADAALGRRRPPLTLEGVDVATEEIGFERVEQADLLRSYLRLVDEDARAALIDWFMEPNHEVRGGYTGEPARPAAVTRALRELRVLSGAAALTDREREVLALIDAGLDYRAVAERLGCSAQTAKVHATRARKKRAHA